jgi:hypothetical protein
VCGVGGQGGYQQVSRVAGYQAAAALCLLLHACHPPTVTILLPASRHGPQRPHRHHPLHTHLTASANLDSGCARSGVKGPLMCGSSSFRLISISWSYSAPASATRFSLWGGGREGQTAAAAAVAAEADSVSGAASLCQATSHASCRPMHVLMSNMHLRAIEDRQNSPPPLRKVS